MQIGIVKTEQTWLYETKAGAAADELFMGWAVGILSVEKDWCRVWTHYGYKGYVRSKELLFLTKERLQYREERKATLVICKGFSDVLAEPRVQAEKLAVLSRGAFVEDCKEEENGYRYVRLADGRKGCLSKSAFQKRRDSDGFLWQKEWESAYFNRQGLPQEEKTFRRCVTAWARQYLHTQYRWAGKSSMGIDCSGLVFMSYMLAGVLIYRDAKILPEYPIKQISMDTIQEGDLLYFSGHVAMYLGNGEYIHATGHPDSFGCVINSLNPQAESYRADLAEKLYAAGGLWQPQEL